MRDIVIRAKRIKTELVTLVVCFLIGFLANLGAIIYYKTSYSELLTSLYYVLLFSLVLYLLWSLIRILFWFALRTKKLTKRS